MMKSRHKMIYWTDEKIKKYWDYLSCFPEDYFSYQVGKSIIDHLYKYTPNAKIALDYGSGLGFLIPHLMEKNISVYALEFSPKTISTINGKFKNSKYFMGAYGLDEIKNCEIKFDLITVFEVIEHLNGIYLTKAMHDIKLMLSENGRAIFTTPNDEDLSKSLLLCPNCDTIFHRWQHIRSWSKKGLYNYLTKHGFKVEIIFDTDFTRPRKTSRAIIDKSKHIIKNILGKSPKVEKLPHLVAIVRKG